MCTRLFSPATTVSYAVVGALVASRQPRNPIGWIFGVVGVFAGLTGLASGYRYVGPVRARRRCRDRPRALARPVGLDPGHACCP